MFIVPSSWLSGVVSFMRAVAKGVVTRCALTWQTRLAWREGAVTDNNFTEATSFLRSRSPRKLFRSDERSCRLDRVGFPLPFLCEIVPQIWCWFLYAIQADRFGKAQCTLDKLCPLLNNGIKRTGAPSNERGLLE